MLDNHSLFDVSLLPYRIRKRIVIVGECWIWTGYVLKCGARQGYGKASRPKGYRGPDVWLVHRITYTLLVGPINQEMTLDHLIEAGICTDTRCCNPAHLEEVTRGVNLRRSISTLAGLHVRKTHCPKGHPYDGSNLRVGKQYDGSNRKARFCRSCHAQHERNRRERLRHVAA